MHICRQIILKIKQLEAYLQTFTSKRILGPWDEEERYFFIVYTLYSLICELYTYCFQISNTATQNENFREHLSRLFHLVLYAYYLNLSLAHSKHKYHYINSHLKIT